MLKPYMHACANLRQAGCPDKCKRMQALCKQEMVKTPAAMITIIAKFAKKNTLSLFLVCQQPSFLTLTEDIKKLSFLKLCSQSHFASLHTIHGHFSIHVDFEGRYHGTSKLPVLQKLRYHVKQSAQHLLFSKERVGGWVEKSNNLN